MTLRHCKACNQDRPEPDFYGKKRPDAKPGFQWICKSCRSEYMKNRIKNETPEQRERRRKMVRENWFRSKYNISVADYDLMFAAQNGLCASCNLPPGGAKNNSVLHVDHDHETGTVRALLCGDCNRAFGIMNEDPDRIWQLLLYARRHQRALRLVA